jgi:type II secretory ATPase GspE/PulE/Tfp pilus assembly ATPase PilB-like protein
MDIGIEPYLVASSVNAFISQRLVRVICPDCKTEMKDKDLLPDILKNIKVYHGKGCDSCKNIGYKGRTAIYELLVLDERMQELILRKAPATQIRNKAREAGFRTLLDSGIEKIKAGETTPEEVFRVAELER